MTMQTNGSDVVGEAERDLRLVFEDGDIGGMWRLIRCIIGAADEQAARNGIDSASECEDVGTTLDDAPRDEVATPARALEIARRILPSAVAVYSSMDDDPLGGWVVLLERLPADAGARNWEYAEVAEQEKQPAP